MDVWIQKNFVSEIGLGMAVWCVAPKEKHPRIKATKMAPLKGWRAPAEPLRSPTVFGTESAAPRWFSGAAAMAKACRAGDLMAAARAQSAKPRDRSG